MVTIFFSGTSLIGNRCREELRNCLKSTVVDGNFTVELDAWHSACDKKLPTPVTTPSYATTFITANLQSCNPIVASCSRWKASASACTSTYTAASDRLSCECEPSMISLGSVCQYDGSRLCEGKTAFITDLWEYSLCPAGSSILSGVSFSSSDPLCSGHH
jgi:hypothetical protein